MPMARVGGRGTAIIWSTPIAFYDTRIEPLYLVPTVGTTNTAADDFYVNPQLFGGDLAHNFRSGFAGSYFAGASRSAASPSAASPCRRW